MNDCEAHEIALERRAAGDLPGNEVAELEAHLAGCATCRRYAQQMERIQAMIQTSNATVDTTRTWRRVNKYVVRREEQTNRKLTRYLPLGMAFMSVTLVLSLIEGQDSMTLFATGFMIASVWHLWVLIARQRKLQRLVDSPRDVLTLVRRELTLKQVLTVSGALLALLLGSTWLGTGLAVSPAWMPTFGYHDAGPFYLVMAAVFFAYAAYLALVSWPRLRRESATFE